MSTSEIMWMVFLGAMVLIAIVTIILLIVDSRQARRDKEKDREAMLKAKEGSSTINIYIDKNGNVTNDSDKVNVITTEPVAEVKAEKPVEEVKEEVKVPSETTKDENGLYIKVNNEVKTFDSQLHDSTKEIQSYYFKLKDYFANKNEKMRINESKSHVLFIFGSYKLCKLVFTRGVLKASFFVSSSEFKRYRKENEEVSIKEKPTVIELNSEAALDACCKLADLTYTQAEEAKASKK